MFGPPFSVGGIPDYLDHRDDLKGRRDDLESRLRDLKDRWDERPDVVSGRTVREIVEGQAGERETVIKLAEDEIALIRDVTTFEHDLHAARKESHAEAVKDVDRVRERLMAKLLAAGWQIPIPIEFLHRHPDMSAAADHAERLRRDSGGPAWNSHLGKCHDTVFKRLRDGELTRWRDPAEVAIERGRSAYAMPNNVRF